MGARRSHANQAMGVKVPQDHDKIFVTFTQRDFVNSQALQSAHINTDFFALTYSTID